MHNIYIQHQINTFIMQLLYIRSMKASDSCRPCIVAITGPPASGKKCFASYISDVIKQRVKMSHLELIPVEIVETSTLSTRYFSELSSNMFVCIFLVTCKAAEKSDISLCITSLISSSKLQKQFNITMARLKAFAFNFNMALENNHLMGLSEPQIINVLASNLYTKRCTSDIALIANDMDYICLLSQYSHSYADTFPLLNIFLQYRPHVNIAFRAHASQKTDASSSADEPILKKCAMNMLTIEFQKM